MNLNYQDVVNMILLADLAYEEPEKDHPFFKDWDVLSHASMQNDLDYCLAIEYRNVLVFSFRGTDIKDTVDEKNYVKLIKRWYSNINIHPLVQQGKWGKGMFHHDMYKIFLRFKDDINQVLRIVDPNKPIVTVGHSRGGPPAVYLHRHLVKNLKKETTKCITFGCPRHMTRPGVLESRMLGLNVFNFINGYDIVTRIPKTLFRNEYDIYLKNPWFLFNGIRNHLQKGYIKTIHNRHNRSYDRIFKAYDNHDKKKLFIEIK